MVPVIVPKTTETQNENDIIETMAEDNQELQDEEVVVAEVQDNTNQPVVSPIVKTELGIAFRTSVSDAKPIANNENVTPVGLVYKVQMAAFRREVPLSTFKGITPVAAEYAPNSAFIRYVAGVFPNYNRAVTARTTIRAKGFTDAFVVVYFNGKRISVGEARQLIASGEAYTTDALSQFAINNNTEYYKLKKAGGEQVAVNTTITETTVEQTQEQVVVSEPQEVVAETPVQKADVPTHILYYSVQVGVYGGPRTADRLFNIQDLYFDRTASGNYRYFSGKFDNEQSAKTSRDRIRVIGIRDAFVVAFRDGQRIGLAQARTMESDARNNRIALSREKTAPASVVTNETADVSPTATQAETTQEIEVQQADNAAEGIVFKVQLGAYRGQRNASQLQVINSMSGNGISSYTNSTGLTIYFSNSYKTYNEARAARNKSVSNGFTDVFVVAMQNGKKMNLRKAMDLLNQ